MSSAICDGAAQDVGELLQQRHEVPDGCPRRRVDQQVDIGLRIRLTSSHRPEHREPGAPALLRDLPQDRPPAARGAPRQHDDRSGAAPTADALV